MYLNNIIIDSYNRKCQIIAENIYNFCEKKFMIEVKQAVKYIMIRKKL